MLNWLKRAFGDAASPPSIPSAADSAPAAQAAASPIAASPTAIAPADAAAQAAAELQRGNRLLDEGRLAEAIVAYEASAGLAPATASLVNLGFALKEVGRLDEARARLAQAVALDARQFDARYLLGAVALALGEPGAAVPHLREALALEPGSDVAALDLCTALHGAGDAEAAMAAAREAAARHPGVADFHFILGNLLAEQGAHADAISRFEQALRLRPGHPETLHNLGVALHSAGRLADAAAALRESIALRGSDARAHGALASVLIAQGRAAEAVAQAQEAVAHAPGDADAHNVLGNALQAQGLLDAAIARYRQAILLAPGHAKAHSNLGMALMGQGLLADAQSSFQRALDLQPGDANTLNNLGNLLQRRDRFTEATAAYRQALEREPGMADAWSNLAGALQTCGEHEEAIACWRQALALKPDFFSAWSNMLFGLSFLPSCTPDAYLAEARAFGAAVAARARPDALPPHPAPLQDLGGDEGARRPLRLGLVSGDLREHPVGFFIEGVLAHLPADAFTLHAYSTSLRDDRLTQRLRPRFAVWRSLVGVPDEDAAAQVRADGIDILIDLAGHTADNRLPLFAWRAAPVQLSWPGYFASTGVPGMDWFLADAAGVPPDHETHFSERIHRLPETRLCLTAPAAATALPVSPLPALARGHLTFGCFQNMTKLGEPVLALWARVLAALPSSRLRLQSRQMADAALRERLLARLARQGVHASRVDLLGPTSRQDYLAAHAEVDIMLDTFPFTGGTTTCESLWMGVPTLTLAGQTLLARQGVSLLGAAGLPDWVAADADAYVARAVAAASDLPALAALRSGLRAQVLASPVFDTPLFAARLAEALQTVWRQRPAATSRP